MSVRLAGAPSNADEVRRWADIPLPALPHVSFALWIVLLGSALPEWFSGRATMFVVVGFSAYLTVFQIHKLRRAVTTPLGLLVTAGWLAPLVLMIGSTGTFSRGDYTTSLACLFVVVCSMTVGISRGSQTVFQKAAPVVIVLASVINICEFLFAPNHWSTSPGRAAGLYINPNLSASVISLYIATWLGSRNKSVSVLDLAMVVIATAGVFVTFSRSGLVLSSVLCAGILALRFARYGTTRLAVLGVFALLMIIATPFFDLFQRVGLTEDAYLRLEWFSSMTLDDESALGRVAGFQDSLTLFIDHFWTGAGPGASERSIGGGPHNMFIAVAADYGVFGLLVFLALIMAFGVRIQRTARNHQLPGHTYAELMFLFWLIGWSLVSHNHLRQPVTLVLLGFFAGSLYRVDENGVESRKLSDRIAGLS